MTKPLLVDQALKKLQILHQSKVPVLFSLSLRWPYTVATGHGTINDLAENRVNIAGRSGSLLLNLDDKTEYRLSGHYQLAEAQKALIPQDLYFQRLNRVRALTVISQQWEANLIFECGADAERGKPEG